MPRPPTSPPDPFGDLDPTPTSTDPMARPAWVRRASTCRRRGAGCRRGSTRRAGGSGSTDGRSPGSPPSSWPCWPEPGSSGPHPAAVEETLPMASTAEPGGSTAPAAAPASASTSSSSVPTEVVVHAAGAVVRPGVYALDVAARVDDLVRAAGGLAPDADGARINLAAPLADGARIYVPRIGEGDAPPVVGVDPTVPARRLRLRLRRSGVRRRSRRAHRPQHGRARTSSTSSPASAPRSPPPSSPSARRTAASPRSRTSSTSAASARPSWPRSAPW